MAATASAAERADLDAGQQPRGDGQGDRGHQPVTQKVLHRRLPRDQGPSSSTCFADLCEHVAGAIEVGEREPAVPHVPPTAVHGDGRGRPWLAPRRSGSAATPSCVRGSHGVPRDRARSGGSIWVWTLWRDTGRLRARSGTVCRSIPCNVEQQSALAGVDPLVGQHGVAGCTQSVEQGADLVDEIEEGASVFGGRTPPRIVRDHVDSFRASGARRSASELGRHTDGWQVDSPRTVAVAAGGVVVRAVSRREAPRESRAACGLGRGRRIRGERMRAAFRLTGPTPTTGGPRAPALTSDRRERSRIGD